jgi:hypothetical protein
VYRHVWCCRMLPVLYGRVRQTPAGAVNERVKCVMCAPRLCERPRSSSRGRQARAPHVGAVGLFALGARFHPWAVVGFAVRIVERWRDRRRSSLHCCRGSPAGHVLYCCPGRVGALAQIRVRRQGVTGHRHRILRLTRRHSRDRLDLSCHRMVGIRRPHTRPPDTVHPAIVSVTGRRWTVHLADLGLNPGRFTRGASPSEGR